MSTKGIWFLPRVKDSAPVFTFTEGGALQLGTILESFNDPSSVLFFPATEEASPAISWPPEETAGTEKNHEHSNANAGSVGGNILATFLSVAKASAEIELKRQHLLKFGKVDHKIVQFKYPITSAAVQAILKQDAIKRQNSGPFRHFLPKPIYVVSGLRIATASFTVTEENKPGFHASAEASLLDPGSANTGTPEAAANPVTDAALSATASHIPMGGKASGHIDNENTVEHEYETIGEKGIVFAYRMHVIRQRASLFADASAFMTDDGDVDPIECVEVIDAVADLKDMKQELIEEVADGVYVYGKGA